jgi:hypothetical protein
MNKKQPKTITFRDNELDRYRAIYNAKNQVWSLYLQNDNIEFELLATVSCDVNATAREIYNSHYKS